jgi:hypothetical protein
MGYHLKILKKYWSSGLHTGEKKHIVESGAWKGL